jgi:hypothetical protein
MGSMRNIVVVEYASERPEKFAAEARCLSDTLTSALIAIHHIGSTSVPGLAAKPIIDILAVVRSLNELDTCNDAMMALGYEAKGEFGIVGRRFFAKGSDAYRTHHVHPYEPRHLETGHTSTCGITSERTQTTHAVMQNSKHSWLSDIEMTSRPTLQERRHSSGSYSGTRVNGEVGLRLASTLQNS